MTDATRPRSGVQLYTLRDAGDDLLTMVPKLGAMGYDGVELYGGQLTGLDPAEVLDVLGEAGMTVSSAHVGLGPDGTVDEAELDRLQAVGVDTVINPMIPELPDPGAVAATAEQFAAAAAQLRHRGMTFGCHNHFWELKPLDDGRPALLHLYEQLDPAVVAEVDVYWAQVGGADAAALVAELGDRVRFLHVKDGPADDPGAPMVAVGAGVVDIPAILRANPAVEWHLVELDRCATDMYEAVAESRKYLATLGLTADRSVVTNVALLGCGMISGAYAPTIAEFDHLDLVACADVDPARATEVAERHGIPEVCTIDELLAHPEVEVIVNLTPASAHEAVTRAILEAGKAAYSEKPLGVDLTGAQALVDLAAQQGLRLGCAPDTFLGAGLQTAAAAIEAGAIGTPLAATAFVMGAGPQIWHPNPGIFYERGAGPLFDMGPYYVTAIVQLLGPAVRVAAMTRDDGAKRMIHAGPRQGEQFDVDVPTHVAATIELTSGVIATLVASFDVAATRHRNIEVYGTEGTLSVPDPNSFGGPVTVRRLGDAEWVPIELRPATITQQRGIGVAEMAWAAGVGRPHRASGDLALHAVDVMASAVTAAQERRTIDLTTTCAKPPLLAEGLPPNTFDD